MLVFLQYFSSNVHYLNDSIYLWNCCNQGQLLNKKLIMNCLAIKIFYNSQFKKYNCNSTHSYNRKIWVGIPSYIIFLWLQFQNFSLTCITASWFSKFTHHFKQWFGGRHVFYPLNIKRSSLRSHPDRDDEMEKAC